MLTLRLLIFVLTAGPAPLMASDLLAESRKLIRDRNFYGAVSKTTTALSFYQNNKELSELHLLRGIAQKKRRSRASAFSDFEKANSLDPDSPAIAREFGIALASGYSGSSDWKLGATMLMQAADDADLDARYYLALYYLRRERYKLSQALNLLNQAADQNHIDSLILLAQLYGRGQIVSQNLSKALSFYKRLATLNHPDGQYNLSLAHYSGQGVVKDIETYKRLTRQSADQWQLNALSNQAGLVMNSDPVGATGLLHKAASLGHERSQFQLANNYLNGFGVARNFSQAEYWFHQADNIPQSKEFLGVMSLNGLGTTQNKTLAFNYFRQTVDLDKKPVNQQSYARMAVLSQIGEGNLDEGFYDQWEQQLDLLEDVSNLNSVIWTLSTCPVEELNRPRIVLRLAKKLLEKTDNPGYLDSVAAAYAINGQFRKARKLQKKAVSELAGTREYEEANVRLNAYKNKRTWVEDYSYNRKRLEPTESVRKIAVFTGEAVKAEKMESAPVFRIGNDAMWGVAILVKVIEEGSLPFFMQEYASFFVHSMSLLTRTCGRLPAFTMPQGINTYTLSEIRNDHGIQYELSMSCSRETEVDADKQQSAKYLTVDLAVPS